MTWALDYDTAIPPLPEPVEVTNADGSTPSAAGWAALERQLPAGCWRIRLRPRNSWSTLDAPDPPSVAYEGTFRVEYVGGRICGSGDLYLRRDSTGSSLLPRLAPRLSPSPHSTGIPISPLDDYRFYLRLESATIDVNGRLTLGLRTYRNDAISLTRTGREARLRAIRKVHYTKSRWRDEGLAIFRAEPGTARSPGKPDGLGQVGESHKRCLRGVGATSAGTDIADVDLLWVSEYLRRIQVTLYSLDGVPYPGTGFGPAKKSSGTIAKEVRQAWQEAFASVGFQVDVHLQRLPKQQAEWDEPDLRTLLIDLIKNLGEDPNKVWGYHLLCVSKFNESGLGKMFVLTSDDSLHARQGSVVAHGNCLGTSYPNHADDTLGDHALHYLYVAIHEMGHALGLSHNRFEDGFMQVPWRSSTAPGRYPPDPAWSFGNLDRVLLKHAPDRWIRPGGYDHQDGFKLRPFDRWDRVRDGFIVPKEHKLSLLCPGAVLLGTPLRVHLLLRTQEALHSAPPLGLKSGHVSVNLLTPSGSFNSVAPVASRLASRAIDPRIKSAGEGLEYALGSMVLVSGRQGMLMTELGPYSIEVRIDWTFEGRDYALSAERQFITVLPNPERLLEPVPVETASEAWSQRPPLAAELSAFEGLLSAVAFADELSDDDEELLRRTLQSLDYGPHFLAIETRRVLQRLAKGRDVTDQTPFSEILQAWTRFSDTAIVSFWEWLDIIKNLILLAPDLPEKTGLPRSDFVPLLKGLSEAASKIPAELELLAPGLDQLETLGKQF